MTTIHGPPRDVASVLKNFVRPARVVVTAGMPYANGPLHLGHLAGAQLPADIYARFIGMVVGRANVLYVNGTDDHGSTSEVTALQRGVPVRELIDTIHREQSRTLKRYDIGHDIYTGTSRPECFPVHKELAQWFLRRLHENGLLEKRSSKQWYDPKAQRFLPDRLVRGVCPNGHENAYSDECDVCGAHYEPTALSNPKSVVSDATPEMRETAHWFLDMGRVSEELRVWIQGKQQKKTWRPAVINAVLELVLPALRFDNTHEPAYKEQKAALPKHKSRYAPGKKVVLVFESRADLDKARAQLGFATEVPDEWAHRSITRDIAWGIPVPDLDPELSGKTLYVWPDSLIAPISFTKVARQEQGDGEQWWRDPSTRVVQFLGQDNVFFYVLMQGAMWLGTQKDIHHLPAAGDFQLTDIVGCCHLLVNGEKMSKSRGNFFTGDQLLDEMGYAPDQIRYFLATLDLAEKQADFDTAALKQKTIFLGGKMNAAFERPLSACHKKFGGVVPAGKLHDKVVADTVRLVDKYLKAMDRSALPGLINDLENYARTINSLFTQHKPHDDRHPLEERQDALYTGFYVLKNLMILLYPFVPSTMERVRQAMNLPASVFSVDELGVPVPAGHTLGDAAAFEGAQFFPEVYGAPKESDEG